MGNRSRRRALDLAATGAVLALIATGCANTAAFTEAPDLEDLESAAVVTVAPNHEGDDAPVSTEIEVTVENGELENVSLTDGSGNPVDGQFRDNGTTWLPDAPLAYATTYVASAVAYDEFKIPAKSEVTFTTMAQPGNVITPSLWNGSEYEYGQAMPVMIDFPRYFSVPEDFRDEVESRLLVKAEPEQPGAWHWFSGNHLEYRPKDFWEPGSVVDIRIALEGLHLGDGVYGMQDLTSTMHISGTTRTIEVSDSTKELVAMENGEVVKTAPVSLGKASTPSYSGTMIIMERFDETVFDTTAACGGKVEGDDCYRTDIQWAERLTWSGQFIHSAPWSVGDQGVRNVSHGCVNVSPEVGKWVYNFTRLGDPVIVKDTGVQLPYGDGFTAYDMSWEEFLQGSYLPDPTSDNTSAED